MLTSGLLTLTLSALCAEIISAQPPFSITISGNQTIFKAGSPIELQVIFTNTSDRGISLFWDKSNKAELSGFEVDVTDSQGHVPKMFSTYNTLTGSKARREAIADPANPGIVISSGGEMILAPGKAERFRTDVSKLFDLREPGPYSVRLKRTDPASGAPVVSNVLKITIAN